MTIKTFDKNDCRTRYLDKMTVDKMIVYKITVNKLTVSKTTKKL